MTVSPAFALSCWARRALSATSFVLSIDRCRCIRRRASKKRESAPSTCTWLARPLPSARLHIAAQQEDGRGFAADLRGDVRPEEALAPHQRSLRLPDAQLRLPPQRRLHRIADSSAPVSTIAPSAAPRITPRCVRQ